MLVKCFKTLTSKALQDCGGGGQSRTKQCSMSPFPCQHVTFPLSPCSPAERGRQADLQLGFSRRTSTTHSRLHSKLLGSAFLHPLKWSTLPLESIQGSQLRSQGFSTVLLGHGVGESRDGKSTWIIRCIPKSSCHRHPCVLFSHPKSCLVGKLPKKGSAHPRPSRSGRQK